MTEIQFEVTCMNIWKEKYLLQQRTEWIIHNIIESIQPDILLLQEVTNENVIDIIQALKEKKYQYRVSNEKRHVFEIIASKWNIIEFRFQKFSTSNLNNGILYCDIQVYNHRVTLASGNIDENLNGNEQLNCALNFLSNHNKYIIYGVSSHLGNELYPFKNERWKDAWVLSGKNKLNEYTYDFDKNINLTKNRKSRPDRIFTQGTNNIYKYELIGTLPICSSTPTSKLKVQPSTHFGIHCRIVYKFFD